MELELAVAVGKEYLQRARFRAPAVVTLGSGPDNTLSLAAPELGQRHELLRLEGEEGRLLFTDELRVQVILGGAVVERDSLVRDGLARPSESGFELPLRPGSKVAVRLSDGHKLLIKVVERGEVDPIETPVPEGRTPACGSCGAELAAAVVGHDALSLCPECAVLNRFVRGEPADDAPPPPPAELPADLPTFHAVEAFGPGAAAAPDDVGDAVTAALEQARAAPPPPPGDDELEGGDLPTFDAMSVLGPDELKRMAEMEAEQGEEPDTLDTDDEEPDSQLADTALSLPSMKQPAVQAAVLAPATPWDDTERTVPRYKDGDEAPAPAASGFLPETSDEPEEPAASEEPEAAPEPPPEDEAATKPPQSHPSLPPPPGNDPAGAKTKRFPVGPPPPPPDEEEETEGSALRTPDGPVLIAGKRGVARKSAMDMEKAFEPTEERPAVQPKDLDSVPIRIEDPETDDEEDVRDPFDTGRLSKDLMAEVRAKAAALDTLDDEENDDADNAFFSSEVDEEEPVFTSPPREAEEPEPEPEPSAWERPTEPVSAPDIEALTDPAASFEPKRSWEVPVMTVLGIIMVLAGVVAGIRIFSKAFGG